MSSFIYLKGSEALSSMSECIQGPMEKPAESPEAHRTIEMEEYEGIDDKRNLESAKNEMYT